MLNDNEKLSGVTIIGGGIIGVCCALSLLERGCDVTIIDKNEPGDATSFGNAGVISHWSCVPQCLPGVWKNIPKWLLDKNGPLSFNLDQLPTLVPWVIKFLSNSKKNKVEQISNMMEKLMFGNIAGYRHYLNGTGRDDLLIDSWYINVFRGEQVPRLDDYAWKLRIDRNAPVKIIGQGELLELEPDLSKDYHSAIVIKDQSRTVDPGNLCKTLAEKAFSKGCNFKKLKVNAISRNKNNTYQLHCDGRNFISDKVVVAAGIWSVELMKSLGLKIPLISERGYHVEFSDPGVKLNNSIMDVAGKFVSSSMANGIRSAGTTEFASANSKPNFERAKLIEKLTMQLLPSLNASTTNYWVGSRPSFPDSLPAVGPISGLPNLFAAFGHSHYGIGMAPATGKFITNYIIEEPQNIDLTPIKLDRFF